MWSRKRWEKRDNNYFLKNSLGREYSRQMLANRAGFFRVYPKIGEKRSRTVMKYSGQLRFSSYRVAHIFVQLHSKKTDNDEHSRTDVTFTFFLLTRTGHMYDWNIRIPVKTLTRSWNRWPITQWEKSTPFSSQCKRGNRLVARVQYTLYRHPTSWQLSSCLVESIARLIFYVSPLEGSAPVCKKSGNPWIAAKYCPFLMIPIDYFLNLVCCAGFG